MNASATVKEYLQKNPDVADRIEADLRSCGLRTVCPFKAGDLVGAMKKDKKAEGGIVHFVLPLGIGHVETRDLQPEQVAILLEK